MGTDSHTPMVNGLGVVGWGVGGIEAEAAMLGQPLSLLLPAVVGVRLVGELPEGSTATDLVLTIAERLRGQGVVGKFVEFYGPGVAAVPLENRATIGNMSPEYGSTRAMFPIDAETLRYLRFTGRSAEQVALVEAYEKEQGLFHEPDASDPSFSETVELDLTTVVPSIAGPSRPHDRVPLSDARRAFRRRARRESVDQHGVLSVRSRPGVGSVVPGQRPTGVERGNRRACPPPNHEPLPPSTLESMPDRATRPTPAALAGGTGVTLDHGDVVIAAITSCTNTSNPSVMVAAGLLAKKAEERGLRTKEWVKTSLAPGSRVVTDYLAEAGLAEPLEALGFHLVGYGCTTCIGNSGPLLDGVADAVARSDLAVCAVLSGNRNFEGRIHPDVRMNYLASPPLVVAYAARGNPRHGSGPRSSRRGYRRPGCLPARHLADVGRSGRNRSRRHQLRHVPTELRRRVHRRRELAQPRRRNRDVVPLGALVDLHTSSPLLRGDGPRPDPVGDIVGARSSRCWATASQRTTSRLRAPSIPTAPPVATWSDSTWRRQTSTPTAHGAAITK